MFFLQGTCLRVDLLDDSGLDELAVGLLPVGDNVPRLIRLANMGNESVVEGTVRPRVIPHPVGHHEIEHL